jgi:hypothetical protein
MTTNVQNALDDKIRKLQQLRDLLSDPEIARLARSILSKPNGAVATTVAASAITAPTRRGRPPKRKRGSLKTKALEIVRKSTGPLSAKAVAEAMESEGFSFEAQDKFIAVSKALRSLAKATKIHYKPGDRPKAAIMYSRLPSLVPVQGETRH